MRRTFGMAVLVCVLAVGCARASAGNGDGTSGIRGVAQVGPQCPVEQVGSPCPDRPIATTIDVYTSGTKDLVAQTKSDSNGMFEVSVPPGTYDVVVVSTGAGGFPVPQPTTVTVRAGEFVHIVLEFDSGIR